MNFRTPQDFQVSLRAVAREAGATALEHFRPGFSTTARQWAKERGSPVTEADIAVDTLLKSRLRALLPEAAWLSEETTDTAHRLDKSLLWIVDPIDGTRAFIAGSPDWSVSIALVVDGRPVFGIVYAPVHDHFYEAARGAGASMNQKKIQVTASFDLEGARVTGPKPMIDELDRNVSAPLDHHPRIPSLALRLARVADGTIDLGLVGSQSRDWDLAAADLILHESGGLLTDFNGRELVYNGIEPVHGELIAASALLHPRVIEAMRTGNRRPSP